jgi:hypothetical protein
LLKDLIGELRSPRDQQSPAVWRNRLDAAGVAASVRSYPQQTITTTILSDGVSLSEARRRVDALVEWIQTLGHFEIQSDHEPETFKLQFRWISSPAAAKVAP